MFSFLFFSVEDGLNWEGDCKDHVPRALSLEHRTLCFISTYDFIGRVDTVYKERTIYSIYLGQTNRAWSPFPQARNPWCKTSSTTTLIIG